MAKLTISAMIENQRKADVLHESHKAAAAEKKATVETAKDALTEALRSGDAAAYDKAVANLSAAEAEAAKYEALADSTGAYLYSIDEVGDAWTVERESFMNGALQTQLAKIDKATEAIRDAYWKAFALVNEHYALGDQVRAELIDKRFASPEFMALPIVTREQLKERCNASHRLGTNPNG